MSDIIQSVPLVVVGETGLLQPGHWCGAKVGREQREELGLLTLLFTGEGSGKQCPLGTVKSSP